MSDYYDSMVEVAQRSLLASPSDAKAPSLGMVAALSIGNDPHSSEPYRQATAWASRDTSLVKYAHEAAFLDLAAVGGFVGTGGDPFQITFDGKHPNDKGHELIANYVFGVLTAGYGYPNVNAFASQGDADAWGFPHTALGDEVKSSSVFPIANAALFLRSRGGGTISQVGLRVRASAGSISVATLIGPGGPNPPTTRTQTSGPISCPAIGFAQIALAGTATLSSTTGWFAVSGDGSAFNVASFDTAGGSASPAQDNAGAGSAYLGSTSHPVPPSPTGLVPCTYARYILIGG